MKSKQIGAWITAAVSLALIVMFLLWPAFRTAAQKKDKPATTQSKSNKSTGSKPVNHGSGIKNADVDQKDIEQAMKELENTMKELKETEWPKMQLEIENAMKEIDIVKIQQEINASMKEVDMVKMQAEIKKAQAEMQKSMKDLDVSKINAEVVKAMKAIDMKAMEKELAAVKNINTEELKLEMAKVKEELARNKIDIKIQLEEAQEQMKKANVQLMLVKEGLDELEKDGLKKKDEKVNIEYKNGILYLNGKAQSQQVSDKYKKYFGDEIHVINNETKEPGNEVK
jgi:chromosome segregation ATPase